MFLYNNSNDVRFNKNSWCFIKTPLFPSTSSWPHSWRIVLWGESTDERFSVSSSEVKPEGREFLGMMPQLSFMPVMPPLVANGDSFSNDYLHEVEL